MPRPTTTVAASTAAMPSATTNGVGSRCTSAPTGVAIETSASAARIATKTGSAALEPTTHARSTNARQPVATSTPVSRR